MDNPKFIIWPKRPPLAFSVAETSVAEMSGPKCPWPKCPTFVSTSIQNHAFYCRTFVEIKNIIELLVFLLMKKLADRYLAVIRSFQEQ